MKLSNHSVPDRLWAFLKPCWGERLASNWHQLPRGPWFSYLAGWVPEWCEALTGQGLVYIYIERESIIYILHLPTHLPIHVSTCPYICIYTYIHTYLSVYLYIHLSIHLSVHLSIRTHTHIQSYTHTHTIYIYIGSFEDIVHVCVYLLPLAMLSLWTNHVEPWPVADQAGNYSTSALNFHRIQWVNKGECEVSLFGRVLLSYRD